MSRIFLVLCLMISLPALAQVGPGLGGGGYGSGGPGGGAGGYTPVGNGHRNQDQDDDSHGGGGGEEKPIPPPPAIPGAQPNEDSAVAPAERPVSEMSPNEALFDAINRGDLAAAKDALSRGAQLEAKNVLGQTPTDAAIDLSRNDITFLLLSMRSGAAASSRPAQLAAAQKPARPKSSKAWASRQPPVQVDRGTPKPEIGFTGF